MVGVDLSPDEKVSFLVSLSSKMGISVDDVLAVYLFFGDKVFFLFDLFQGKTLRFPSLRSLHHSLSSIDTSRFIRLRKSHYLVNGVDSYSDGIVEGDEVVVDGVKLTALGSPLAFLGESYILVRDDHNDGGKDD